jgi:hypothetical protein
MESETEYSSIISKLCTPVFFLFILFCTLHLLRHEGSAQHTLYLSMQIYINRISPLFAGCRLQDVRWLDLLNQLYRPQSAPYITFNLTLHMLFLLLYFGANSTSKTHCITSAEVCLILNQRYKRKRDFTSWTIDLLLQVKCYVCCLLLMHFVHSLRALY